MRTQTSDSYVTHIRQVATLLGYGEPQILEIFKTDSLWIILGVVPYKRLLRQMVETAKRMLTKEKIDRQLAGQSSSTPFMSMKDSYINNKNVTFDTQSGLEEKTDRLTMMMSKWTTKEEGLKVVQAKNISE